MKKAKRYRSIRISEYHGSIVCATPRQLRELLGKPDIEQEADSANYTSYEWIMQTDDGIPFSVFDWMEFREFDEDEEIEWYISGENKEVTDKISEEISNLINNK